MKKFIFAPITFLIINSFTAHAVFTLPPKVKACVDCRTNADCQHCQGPNSICSEYHNGSGFCIPGKLYSQWKNKKLKIPEGQYNNK